MPLTPILKKLDSKDIYYGTLIMCMLLVWAYSMKMAFNEMEMIRARLIISERMQKLIEQHASEIESSENP